MTTLSSAGGVSRLTAQDVVKLKKYLIDSVSRAIESEGIAANQRDDFIKQQIESVYDQANLKLPQDVRGMILKEVLNELLGYGPLQPLLRDPEITEVMVNGPKKIYVEKKGQLQKSSVVFDDDNHVLQIIDRIILPLGRRIDADSPTVDARLPDGSRVNAVIPPVAIDGPSITIRKFSKEKLGINNLIDFGSITEKMAEFLRACVLAHLNIIISGGTGSGKTTLLNVLSSYIPENERIITIEDAAELQLQQDHVLRMETKPADVDGNGAVAIPRDDKDIETFEDLKGKRVYVGGTASSRRDAMDVLMEAHGWTGEEVTDVSEFKGANLAEALCDDEFDAFVYAIGHPNPAVREATALCDAKFVEVSTSIIEKLNSENPFYVDSVIPGGTYKNNSRDVPTLGVVATLVTTAKVPPDVIYHITKAYFENLGLLQALSPLFLSLTKDQMVETGLAAPIHEGALKYFSEVGLK